MRERMCPKCDHSQKDNKSRKDEYFNEDGNAHRYIYCWWCGTLLFYKVNGKIEWDLWSNSLEGLCLED